MEKELKFVLRQLVQTEQNSEKQVLAETLKEDFESFLNLMYTSSQRRADSQNQGKAYHIHT